MTSSIVACGSCEAKNRVPVSAAGRPRCAKCHIDLPWLVEARDEGFGAAVAGDHLVLVDLWAPWCGPCRTIAPILQTLAADYAGRLKVVKVNVDDSPTVARQHNASSIPLLLFIRNGTVLERVVGAQPERVFRQHVDRLLRV